MLCMGILAFSLAGTLAGCGRSTEQTGTVQGQETQTAESEPTSGSQALSSGNGGTGVGAAEDGFVRIQGGTFQMGSPEEEAWRSADEILHAVTLDDFYMSPYEVTQDEYSQVMGANPSAFFGDEFPVETVSWLDAIRFCNTLSERQGLEPVYEIADNTVSWNRDASGYRLPTEAEWEYACRAGTTTPFNTQTSISAEEANYWGDYPYMIEDNYFSQGNLETKPGVYRQTTTAVGSFLPNAWGLYDMHGNVGEWVWDYYGAYESTSLENPTGPESGTRRVNRGGGWNDFAKNLRSAYRAAMPQENSAYNVGLRLARNAEGSGESGTVVSGLIQGEDTEMTDIQGNGRMLVAYFSWGGNTRGIAREVASQTGAELFEIEMVHPYSNDYSTVLDQAQKDQNVQARPELASHVEDMSQYDVIFLGYPNWWASIPMPVASFLEEYDFAGKTIIPFCSHGGGRFGQSLTAIAKLAPEAEMSEGLAISYSGGSSLAGDITAWLDKNGIAAQ
ncbi:SUMF1/EgtB/PvdO family nonheme iron enzyme [Clostridium sp. MCC353]|nr:SUMF1/EgtB/PvdO family nonheme iron enzyme [Clostridium sp. MCC353]